MTDVSYFDLPLMNWVFFGIGETEQGNYCYTYGLYEFDKKEFEITNSNTDKEELHSMMYNLVHYVLAENINLNPGETIGLSEEQRLLISNTNNKFTDKPTLAIKY